MHRSRRLQTGVRGRLGVSPLLRHSPVRAPPPDDGAGGDSADPLPLPVPVHGPHEVYVGNWPSGLDELQIAALFHKYSIYPKHVHLHRVPLSDGYAFVDLGCPEDVVRAIDQLHGGKVLGHQIVVTRSRGNRKHRAEQCLPNGDGDMSGAFDEVIVVGEVVETEEYELSPPPSPPARPCSPNMPPLVLPGPTQVVRRQFSDRDEGMYDSMFGAKRLCTRRVGGGTSPPVELMEDSGSSALCDLTPDSGSGQQSARSSAAHAPALSAAAPELIRRRLHQPVDVLVANFPANTPDLDIMDLFGRYKPLKVRIMVNDPSQHPEAFTYAYVTVFSTMMADSAVLELDGRLYRGRHLVVEVRRS